MSIQSEEECQWLDAFQNRLKKRNFEQFSILLFDFHESSLEQRILLHRILFDDHTSVTYWANYIEYACANFDKKNHLQRLVNKALEFLDEKNLKDDPSFLAIHLNSVKLKSTQEEMLRYFQNTLWKREIGKRHANLYLAWADLEFSTNGMENSVSILQKGIDCGAEPIGQLRDKLVSLLGPAAIKEEKSSKLSAKNALRSKTLTYFDNGEVQFNKKIDVTVDQDATNTPMDEKEEDITETQKISIPETNGTSGRPRISNTLKRLKLSSSGSLGKSQRIANIPLSSECEKADANISKSYIEQHLPQSISSESDDAGEKKEKTDNSNASKKKVDLSKYIDDNIKNFNPLVRKTKELGDNVSSSQEKGNPSEICPKKLPFSVMETNVDVPLQSKHAFNESVTKSISIVESEPQPQKMPVQPSNAFVTNAMTHAPVGSKQLPLEPNISYGSSNQSATFEILDDSEMATIKVQTEELKNLFAAIPKEPVKLSSLPTGATKRKRVSFSPQDESSNIDQRKSKEMKIQQNQVPSSSTSSTQVVSITMLDPSFGMFAVPEKYISVCGKRYVQTALMGKGGSSAVKRVISCDDGVIYALKVVEIKDNEDSDSVFDSYANEISLLQTLKGTSPYIIDLVDSEISRQNLTVTMLLEAGDIDLAKLLNQKQKQSAPNSSGGLDPIFSRMVWKEMLLAVHHIHEHRIVHGDLKPANFVFVKGHLKLIDFGIAKSFSTDTTNIYRDSQIGTVNYMAPEAIAPMPESICHNRETNNYSMKLGRASDIWSLGCILYQIVFTRPPFAALNTIQKLSAIPNPKFEIQYPSCDDLDAVESIKSCLKRNPKERSPIVGERGLLTMKYLAIPFTTAASAQNPRQETVVFDENAVMEKHGPLIIEGVKLAVMEKLSCETNLNVLEKVFDSIDIQSLIRQAMKGHTYLSKELTAASATITATTTTTAVPATNKTQKESSSRLKTPSKLLNSLDKENQQSTKISNLGHTATKKFVGESSKAKSPLKILPLSLKQQIHNESNKLRSAQSAEGIANASKWQKAITETEPGDLRTALEKRIDQMRKFLSDDQENHTATESIDLSFSYNFM